MWVITKAVNDYNQHGVYLETVYEKKPSLEELIHYFKDKKLAGHVFNGGGRIDFEDVWYYLEELKTGEKYIHS